MSLVEPPPEACPGTGTEESGKVTNSLKILTGNYSHWDLYSNNYSQSDSTPAGCCLWRLSKPVHLRLSWPCCSGPWCWPHRKEPRRSQKHCPRPLWKSNTSRIFSISGRFDCREGLVRVQWQQLWRDVLPQKRIWQWGCLILTSVVLVCQGDFSFWSKKSEMNQSEMNQPEMNHSWRMMGCEGEGVHQSGSGWSPVFVEDNLSVMSAGFLLSSPG